MRLTKKAIGDLRRFCEWVDGLPRKSVYPSVIGLAATVYGVAPCPEESIYWLSEAWREQRKYADVIFYGKGWGWRLRKNWRERLDQIESELPPEPKTDDAVLGGQRPQPRPGDVVRGGSV